MTGEILVTTEALVSQADAVNNLVTTMAKDFQQIKERIDSTQSYWIGEAGNLYRDKYKAKESDIEMAIKRLREHVRDLKIMAGVYTQAEAEAKSEAESLVSTVI